MKKKAKYLGAITNLKIKGAKFIGVFELPKKGEMPFALPIKSFKKVR